MMIYSVQKRTVLYGDGVRLKVYKGTVSEKRRYGNNNVLT